MNARLSLPLILGLLSAACAGAPSSTPAFGHAKAPAPSGGDATASADYYGGGGSAESAAADGDGAYQPSSPSSHRRSQVREERPGLGTVFGETVTSHVRTKPFARATSRPFATVALYYNDENGIKAHANYLGTNGLAPFRAHTPAGGISVALTDEYGNLLSGGIARGRALIVGAEGRRYNIVLQNQTGGRFEVVASVDGLDVIDGRPADLAKRGYILEPYGSLTIDGFRRSETAVAAFRFGRVSQSYAARTSGDRNVGVVGVAFFAERGSVWTNDELRRRDTANPFPGDRDYARPPTYRAP